MSNRNARSNLGCLGRLIWVLLFGSLCYWLLLAPVSAPGGGAGPTVAGELTPGQQAAFDRLSSTSGEPPHALAEASAVRFLSASVVVSDSLAVSAPEKALYFLKQNSDLYQLGEPGRNLRLEGKVVDEQGTTFVRYTQQVGGVPVFGSDVIVAVSSGDAIESVSAGYAPLPEVTVQPRLRSREAEAAALADLGPTGGEVITATTLVIYDPRVFGEPAPDGPRLAWHVTAAAHLALEVRLYLVDAETGAILNWFDDLHTVRRREVWDAQGLNKDQAASWWNELLRRVKQVMNESGPLEGQSPDEDARQSWANAAIVYDFYWNTFRRDSFDGRGTRLKLVVNVSDSSWCPNAGWANSIHTMFYCDGRGGSLDVLAHEFTHGVVGATARLTGSGESGALGESYPDVFAALLEGAQADARGQSSANTWRITWDEAGLELIRDLGHPADGYPEHYDNLVQPGEGPCTKEGEKKAGCPHINSSIPSLAAFLAAEGGERRDITVRGIGRVKLQYIYYEALTHRLTKNANFAQARAATLRACWYLTGQHGITADDCSQIRNAFAAVGVGEPSAPAQPGDATDWLKWLQNLVRDSGVSLQEWVRQQFDALAGDIRQRIAAMLRDLERQIQEAIRRGIQSLIQLIVQLILDALRQLFRQVCGAPLVSLGAPILAVVWWWRHQRR